MYKTMPFLPTWTDQGRGLRQSRFLGHLVALGTAPVPPTGLGRICAESHNPGVDPPSPAKDTTTSAALLFMRDSRQHCGALASILPCRPRVAVGFLAALNFPSGLVPGRAKRCAPPCAYSPCRPQRTTMSQCLRPRRLRCASQRET
jgi:hypothetical protein